MENRNEQYKKRHFAICKNQFEKNDLNPLITEGRAKVHKPPFVSERTFPSGGHFVPKIYNSNETKFWCFIVDKIPIFWTWFYNLAALIWT